MLHYIRNFERKVMQQPEHSSESESVSASEISQTPPLYIVFINENDIDTLYRCVFTPGESGDEIISRMASVLSYCPKYCTFMHKDKYLIAKCPMCRRFPLSRCAECIRKKRFAPELFAGNEGTFVPVISVSCDIERYYKKLANVVFGVDTLRHGAKYNLPIDLLMLMGYSICQLEDISKIYAAFRYSLFLYKILHLNTGVELNLKNSLRREELRKISIARLIKLDITEEKSAIVDILYERHVINMITNPLTAAINASIDPIIFEYCAREGIIDVHVRDRHDRTLYAYVDDPAVIQSLRLRKVDASWFNDKTTNVRGMVMVADDMDLIVKYKHSTMSDRRKRRNIRVEPRECHEPRCDSLWCPSEWRCWNEL